MKNNYHMNQTLTIEKPTVADGALMWQLVKQSTLDLNSPYKYIMMCEYFRETCVVVKENDELHGFITAFIPPDRQDVIFVWQVGVDPSQQGKGIASKMLQELLSRPACKNVRYLEATVTPSNIASQSLFRGYARKNQTNCVVKECFSAELFPGKGHEEELTFRVGPLS
ncbi:diaminobutyrate acetyltransferase [Anaerobacillus alkalilacustris]|uniref:L-2,4-diaminobutyric acid acetyltransferase n=1 Tax=Anaerobacillus alkalilacustris TaxID=393763 RepID=A0A1S2LYB8_9BACI|nr:diaminobutyrate acetyltransferase [Anaerobacillus alkalilacustris]OIJ17284.1 diaminobutyrate acetyltransferase [Anaerobacillus alkalilacustris]